MEAQHLHDERKVEIANYITTHETLENNVLAQSLNTTLCTAPVLNGPFFISFPFKKKKDLQAKA
jgi:hypothetical protein